MQHFPFLSNYEPKTKNKLYCKTLQKNIELSKRSEGQEKKKKKLHLLLRNNQSINPLCSPAPKTKTSKSKFSLSVRRCHADLRHTVFAGPPT